MKGSISVNDRVVVHRAVQTLLVNVVAPDNIKVE